MRTCHEGSAHYKKNSVHGRLTIQLDLFYHANADPEKWLRHADGRLFAVQAVDPEMLLSEFVPNLDDGDGDAKVDGRGECQSCDVAPIGRLSHEDVIQWWKH